MLLLLLCGSYGFADTFITAPGVDWSRGGGVWLREDNNDVNAYFAGVIFISLTEDGHQYDRDSLCVDLFTDIYLGVQYGTTVVNPYDVPGKNLPRVSWLVDNALLPTQGPIYLSQLTPDKWVYTREQGIGIQLAIWDIVHDNGDGFAAGRLQAVTNPANPTDPAALAWAQYYEAASLGHTSYSSFIYVNVDLGNGSPAQMLAGPQFLDGGPHGNPEFSPLRATPEPSTMLLMGSALIAAGVVLKRRRAANYGASAATRKP